MNHRRVLPTLVLAAIMGTGSGHLYAADCGDRPSVSIQALSSEDIANDMVRMHWTAQIEREDSSSSMKEANDALDAALKALKANKKVLNLKTNVQTYPVYGKNRLITSWRGTGNLSFEMSLSELEKSREIRIAAPLVLRNLEYFTSEAVREGSRNRLLKLAMKEFQEKAGVVTAGFNYDGYELANINVNDERQYGSGPMPMMRAMATSADAPMRASDVAASGGTSQMNVSVNGQVCLIKN